MTVRLGYVWLMLVLGVCTSAPSNAPTPWHEMPEAAGGDITHTVGCWRERFGDRACTRFQLTSYPGAPPFEAEAFPRERVCAAEAVTVFVAVGPDSRESYRRFAEAFCANWRGAAGAARAAGYWHPADAGFALDLVLIVDRAERRVEADAVGTPTPLTMLYAMGPQADLAKDLDIARSIFHELYHVADLRRAPAPPRGLGALPIEMEVMAKMAADCVSFLPGEPLSTEEAARLRVLADAVDAKDRTLYVPAYRELPDLLARAPAARGAPRCPRPEAGSRAQFERFAADAVGSPRGRAQGFAANAAPPPS